MATTTTPSNPSVVPDASVPQKLDTSDLIGLDKVRTRLAWVWLIGAGITVIILIFQSLLQRFGDATQEAWGWLLPTIVPTLSIIITVLTYTALDPVLLANVVRKDFFRLATILSVAYLALVAVTVLIGPFVATSGKGMIALMHMSNLWLGPIQGLVASALGVLFVTREKKPQ